MATILIVEDRPIDRKLLATILKSAGHDVVEAVDGQEALRLVSEIHPDLIISDILMPSIDGYEFVRRLRETPAVAATPVIFYTATYHEHEARTLANQCGVFDILMKPSSKQSILATVDAALAAPRRVPDALPSRTTFDREHLRVVESALAERVGQVEAEAQRLAAINEATQTIAAQRDPTTLLKTMSAAARQITLAQHAVTGLLDDIGGSPHAVVTSGVDDARASGMQTPSVSGSVIGTVVSERRPMRQKNPDGRPETLGLPGDDPPISSLLNVPIASSDRVYGWLSLRNKLGADEFTAADEHAALTLATHAAVVFENARLIDDLPRRVAAARDEERARLARRLHDQLGQLLVGLKMDLDYVRREVESARDAKTTPIGERLQRMIGSVDEMIAFSRAVARELRPGVAEMPKLAAAIETEARQFERRFAIRCRVSAPVEPVKLDPERTRAVALIVREALNNIGQHAGATRVTLSVRRSHASLRVSVADNGRGIPEAAIANGDSLGLTGMRERAAMIGGTLDVRRGPRGGTIVTLTIPAANGRATQGRKS